MPSGNSKVKDKVYMIIFAIFAIAIGLLVWNQYRPRVILAQCSEIALNSSQSYTRAQLVTDSNTKTYESLMTECLKEFGY